MTFQSVSLGSLTRMIAKEMSYGTLEAMLMSPSRPIQMVLAAALWDFIVAFLRTVGLLAIAAFIFNVDLSSINGRSAFVMILLTLASLLGFGLFSAGYLLAFKRGDPFSFVLDGVSKLFAGVYFPIQIFPEWIQGLSSWIPFTHALSGLRKAILMGAPPSDLTTEILFLSFTAMITIPAGVVFFHRMVEGAKKRGSLSFS